MVDHPASLVETSFWLQVLSLPEDRSLSKAIDYELCEQYIKDTTMA